MNRFEKELKEGNFVCGECPNCKNIVWPPSEYCSACLGGVIWRGASRSGTLIEYSRKNGEWFGMAEFEGKIRILGTIMSDNEPRVGQKLRLEKCGYDEGERFLFNVVGN